MTAAQIGFAPPIAFTVRGVPEPQGSARAFVVNGRAVVTTDNPDLKKWRRRLALAVDGMVEHPISSPVAVTLRFVVERPPSVLKRVLYPAVIPDLDKLARAVLDGISQPVEIPKREGGGETRPLLRGDQLVVDLVASKRYAGPGQQPGVSVEIHILPGRA